jgi:tRNA(Ile)-lysidine synthase
MEEYVDLDAVHPPLVVRTRRSGDRFFPLGAPGSKKLSDFLIGAKVDPKARERVAVLCDQLGPIWVIGHRIDDRVKLTALTRRVLHLRARPLEP